MQIVELIKEMVGMGLQLLVQAKQVESDTDFVVLQVDVTNAFNSISRDAVLMAKKDARRTQSHGG